MNNTEIHDAITQQPKDFKIHLKLKDQQPKDSKLHIKLKDIKSNMTVTEVKEFIKEEVSKYRGTTIIINNGIIGNIGVLNFKNNIPCNNF